jgi:hypothetical protein
MDPNAQNPRIPNQTPDPQNLQQPNKPIPQPQIYPTPGQPVAGSVEVSAQPQQNNTSQVFGMVTPESMGTNTVQNVQKRRISIKLVIKILILIVVLVVIAVGVILIPSMLNKGPKKYITADLVTEKTSSVAFSRPKSWVDGKDIDKIKTEFNSNSEFHDTIAFADAIMKDKNGKVQPKFAYVFVAKSNNGSGLTNDQLQEFIATPELKSQFEQEINASFTTDSLKSGNDCESIDNLQHNIVYASSFQITLNIEGDCIYNSERQKEKGTESAHLIASVGLQQSDSYILGIAAKKQSWDINQELYRKMIADFKAN